MKQWILRMYCRWFGHKVHHEPFKPGELPDSLIGLSAPVKAVYCERCGERDLYGWMVIGGYMEEIQGNIDVLKGKRPEGLEE